MDAMHATVAAARAVLRGARMASLGTLGDDGLPSVSLVTPAAAPDGSVLLLLSSLAAHTRHMAANPACALLLAGAPTGPNPQTAPRLTLRWTARASSDPVLRQHWLVRHPYAALYADFPDFGLWRVVATEALFVGGFARADRLPAAALSPAADAARAIAGAEVAFVAQARADHADAVTAIARSGGRHGTWVLVGVDCDGVDLRQDETVVHVPFKAPVADPGLLRAALLRLAEQARR